MKNPSSKVTSKSVRLAKTTNVRVYNPNPLDRKPFPGDKRPSLKSGIRFYKVEGNDKSDNGDKTVIHFKIYKSGAATKQRIKRLNSLVMKYIDRQGPKVVCVLHEINVEVFEHLGITTWWSIYQRWMYVDQVLRVIYLTKFINAVLACKELFREESGDQWGLGES